MTQDTTRIVRKVVQQLESAGNSARRAKSSTYCPTAMRVIGVSNPELYSLIRALRKEHPEWSDRQWIDLGLELVGTGIFECRGIAFELIGRNRKLLELLTPVEVSVLAEGLDNWASVDHFAVGIHGVLWRMGKVTDRDIEQLLRSEDPWKRRVAVVSTVALNLKSRGGTGDAARTLKVCEAVVKDHHDMIQKALSWALRELSKREPRAVQEFMERHHNALAGRVVREVNHKLKFGTKN